MRIPGASLSVVVVLLLCAVLLAGCGGSGDSSTSAPSSPTGVVITAGNAQASVSWPAVSGASSYNIYWSTSSGATPATGSTITGATSPYTLTGLTNEVTYYFTVSAVNAYGESTASEPISAVPAPSISILPAGDAVFTLEASGFVNPAGFHLMVSYDTLRCSNPRVVLGSIVSGGMTAVNASTPGVVQIAVVSATPFSGSGPLATIAFDQIGASPGPISVTGIVIDVKGRQLPVTYIGWTPPDASGPVVSGSPNTTGTASNTVTTTQ